MSQNIEQSIAKLTKTEFKNKALDAIKDDEFSPELLRKFFKELPEDKLKLFSAYSSNDSIDPISDDKFEWEREGYFYRQLAMIEKNFCLKRIEHLIEVKSYLRVRGIAGFSTPKHAKKISPASSPMDNNMTPALSSVDITGFTPSRSLNESVMGDDMSSIRIALFLEMNDNRLSNKTLRQAFCWTLARHPNLFVNYDENIYAQSMELDESKWDSNYYSLQEVYTSMNFSEERIQHMLKVREQVFNIQPAVKNIANKPDAIKSTHFQPQNNPNVSSNGNSRKPDTTNSTGLKNKDLNTLLLIGGSVAALALIFLAVII